MLFWLISLNCLPPESLLFYTPVAEPYASTDHYVHSVNTYKHCFWSGCMTPPLFTNGLAHCFLPDVIGWTSSKGNELSSQRCIFAPVQSSTSEGSTVAEWFKRLFPGVINSATALRAWVSEITIGLLGACCIVESLLFQGLAGGRWDQNWIAMGFCSWCPAFFRGCFWSFG